MACSEQITFASLVAENQRLRSLVERLHDHFSPADCELFPQHGEEICRVFFLDPAEQDAYWFHEARRALGVDTKVILSRQTKHIGRARCHDLFELLHTSSDCAELT